jgi:Ricin-type beta-trefoil lectin domain
MTRRALRGLPALAGALLAGTTLAVVPDAPASGAIGAVRAASGRCLDVPGASTENGQQVSLYDCNNGSNQEWNYTAARELRVYGTKCLAAANGGSAAGTAAVIADCTGQAAQQWTVANGGAITGAGSGLCLDTVSGGTANGTLVVLNTCNGGSSQRWNSTVGAAGCPAAGRLTYTLNRAAAPTADQADAYQRITAAMNLAVAEYNCYTTVTKALTISYDPAVATADGSYNGSIRFGSNRSYMVQATAQHEIGHTLGVGTYSGWAARLSGGLWTGSRALAEVRSLSGDPSAVLHGDSQHFWPYGLNQASEATSADDYIANVRVVAALRADMGL